MYIYLQYKSWYIKIKQFKMNPSSTSLIINVQSQVFQNDPYHKFS